MLGFGNRSVFLKYDENDTEITFLTYEQLANYYKKNGQQIQPCIYLFAMDGEDYFLTDIPEEIQVEGFAFHTLFLIRRMHPKEKVYVAATGWLLYLWYRDNQFCGRCAGKLVHDTKARMLRCPHCGNLVFPKIAPAVIIGLIDGDRIMMTNL